MLKKAVFLVLALCVTALPALAEQVHVSASDQPYEIEVLESGLNRTVLQYEINTFDISKINIAGSEYSQVSLANRARHMVAGMPELPTLRESIVIPDDAAMQVRLLASEYRDFTGIDVAPSKGHITRNIDPATVPYSFGDFYGQNAWYPAETALLDEPYIMRDHRGVVVEVNPFQYNPATRTLRVWTKLVVEIDQAGPARVNVLMDRPTARVQEFESLYDRHFLNYKTISDRYSSVPEIGNMVVIYYDSFASQIQPLVDWKNQMGIPTEMYPVSDCGTTGTALKAWVQDYYNNTGVTFILLVGDAAQIPYLSYGGGASDPSLSLLAGGDSYPEAFVGRLSAVNATQVETQVLRSIEYERDAQAGADWYHKGVGIGSSEGAGIGDDGEADWVHMDNIRTDLLAYTYTEVDRIYPNTGANATMVSNAVNNGRTVINYCGHGGVTSWTTTGFSNSHVNALVNDNMLPHVNSVACVTGKFTSGTCFAEAWLQATHNGEPTGAVAVYASTINMSWAPPMSSQDETVDLLVADAKRTIGGLFFNGSCLMMDEYGSTGQTEFKCWTIFGDPSLRVRTDTPVAPYVSHDETIDPAAATFEVNTEPGALVGLSYMGEYHGSAVADGAGLAVVTIVGTLPDEDITLTVSAFNKLTHVVALPTGVAAVPACDVDPMSIFRVLVPGAETTVWLHISNNGEPESILDFTVQVFSLYSRWLSARPTSGEVPEGGTYDIEVTLNAGTFDEGSYGGELYIDSNDPRGRVTVPVTMVVSETGTATGETPAKLILGLNHPNPFNPKTAINFALPADGQVELIVFNSGGRVVNHLLSGHMEAGQHYVVWDGSNDAGEAMPSGVYFYRLMTDEGTLARKMLMLK